MRPRSPCEQLCAAIERGDIAAVSRLLTDPEIKECRCRAGSERIDYPWKTPLHTAAREGDPDIVKLLISHGFDVNRRASSGETALWDAIGGSHDPRRRAACIDLLLKAKIDLNARDNDYQLTALHKAVMLEDVAAVDLLLQRGAPPDVQDKLGRTALHLAANIHQRRGDELAAALLKHHANPNVQDHEGCTPLHYVGKYQQSRPEATAKVLIEHGADLSIRDDAGMTAGDSISRFRIDAKTEE